MFKQWLAGNIFEECCAAIIEISKMCCNGVIFQ